MSDRIGESTSAVILASASPRRRELLGRLGLEFRIVPAHIDETEHVGEMPQAYVVRIAIAKARAVLEREQPSAGTIVLAADTTVDLDGTVLAKPTDDDDARRMLRSLAGRTHQVHTAVVGSSSVGQLALTVTTDVTFARFGDAEIAWYLGLGEHRDKAGAYGMQGAGGAFVERIDGSPSNVIGLPMAETVDVLRACGATVLGR